MIKSFLCICVLAGIVGAAPTKGPVLGLGFAAGQPSGVGLSFRKLTDNYGLQVTIGALSQNQDNWEGYDSYQIEPDAAYWKPSTEPFTQKHYMRETNANLGILLFKVLHSAPRSRFYVFAGGSVFYNIDSFEEHTYEYQLQSNETFIMHEISSPKKTSEYTTTFYSGIGIGMELRITQNIRVAVEWPLTLSSHGDFVMYIPQAGLHYFF